jgi:oligopeptide/dipeptide ABC transporter ATP-binding protein
MLFVTHDIGLARKISDRIAVMLAGRIVELGPASAIMKDPRHPYTRLLLESASGRHVEPRIGESDAEGVSGCAFAPRCPSRLDRCLTECPVLQAQSGREVACHASGPAE